MVDPRSVAVAMLAITTVLVAAPRAEAAAAGPRLLLQDESLVVAPNGRLHLAVTVANAPPDAELIVRVCRNLRAGETMDEAVNGKVDCAALGLFPRIPVTDAPITIDWPTYNRRSEKPPVAVGEADPVQLPNTGVYPIQIEVHSGDHDEVVARLVTFVLRAPVQSTTPTVAVSVVFALPDHTTLRPDGTTVVDTAAKNEIERLTALLTARPADPIAASVSPAVISALASSPATLPSVTNLVTALGNRPLLPRTYDGLSLSGTLAAGRYDDLVNELRAGEDALRAATGEAPDRRTWLLDDTTDDNTVGVLRDLGASQLLLPAAALGLRSSDQPRGRVSLRLGSSSGALPPVAAAIDAQESETLLASTDPVLAAYRFAASLLLDEFTALTPTSGAGIVLVAPDGWWQNGGSSPEELLGVLTRIPELHLVTPDQWFRSVSAARDADGPMVRRLTPRSHPDLSAFAQELTSVRNEVAATASMLPGGTLSTDVDPLLRTSLTAGLDSSTRQAYLFAVRAKLAVIRNSVQPIPKRTITIAGGVTRLPLNLRSTYSEPIRVKLRLTSSKLKFLGTEGLADSSGRYEQEVTLEPNTDMRVVIPVESRATNTFPLIVEVLTPTGNSGLVPATELTIRANRLSGLGVALSAGGLVVLATWWAHHLRRNRRSRHASASAGRHPAGSDLGATDTATGVTSGTTVAPP